jgi:hypothetical protein
MNRYKVTIFLPYPGNYKRKEITLFCFDIIQAINIVKKDIDPRFFQVELL